MKKLLDIRFLLLGQLIFCIPTKNYAQKYEKVFNGQIVSWNVYTEWPDFGTTDNISSLSDTVFNGVVFHRVKSDGSYIPDFWYLEDIDGKSLYAFPPGQDTMAYQIMDMRLVENDTFFLHSNHVSPNPYPIIVDSVWKQNGRKHIRFNYNIHAIYDTTIHETIFEKLQFIEGIGPNISIFFPNDRAIKRYLLCTSKDTLNVYRNNLYNGSCFFQWVGLNYHNYSTPTIYPNPFSIYTEIKTANSQESLSFSLTDLQGRKYEIEIEQKENEYKLYRNKLNAGFYILNISGDNKENIYLRILIQD